MSTENLGETLRKRVPFRRRDDGEDETRVLDEQEQEEVIENLKGADIKSRKQNSRLAQAMIAASFLLHILYLFSPSGGDPISNIFDTTTGSRPLPFATTFTFLHLLLFVNLNQRFLPPHLTIKNWLYSMSRSDLAAWIPLSYKQTAAIAVVAPVLSLIAWRSASCSLWWSLAGLVTGLCWVIERWNQEGERQVQELEGLKYEAKGA